MKTILTASNRRNKTVTIMHGFTCWEQLQGAFQCGIIMPDGQQATAIGRHSRTNFYKALESTGWLLIGNKSL